MSITHAIVSRMDSWMNALTGLGGTRDKAAYTTFSGGALVSDETLEALYNGDDIAARICDAVPEELLRQGIEIVVGGAGAESAEDSTDIVSSLHARLDELEARQRFTDAMVWARVFGGAAIFVGADDGLDPSEPIDEGRIRTIGFLTVLDRRDLQPETYYEDPRSPQFGEPETYKIVATSSEGWSSAAGTLPRMERLIHESRLIRFDGTRATKRRRSQQGNWGGSVLARCYTPLAQFNGHWLSVSHLVQDASQGIFHLKGLIDMIASGEKAALATRMEIVDMSRSVARAIMLDADSETFTRVATSFTGLPEILDKATLRLAAAARMPATILMGREPAGLNATGESDIRWWYDSLRAAQGLTLRPRMERLMRLLMLAKDSPTGGVEPESWELKFPPLWQPSPTEMADLRAKVAATDVQYINAGVVLPEEITLSRFRPEGYSTEYVVDLTARQEILEAEMAKAVNKAAEPEPVPPPPPFGGRPPPEAPVPPSAPADEDVDATLEEAAE